MERNRDSGQGHDTQEALDRALERKRDDLVGDTDDNRNLSGSSTFDNLPDQQGDTDDDDAPGR